MTAQASDLRALVAPHATERAVGGNAPLRLDSSDRAWLIAHGTVEVFTVRDPGDGGPRGARTHIATVHEGDMLFGLGAQRAWTSPGLAVATARAATTDPAMADAAGVATAHAARHDGTPEALVAVAHPGSVLLETQTAVLTQLARDPQQIPLLERAVEGWIHALYQQIPRKTAPQRFEALQAGTETLLEAKGQVAGTTSDVVWVRHLDGTTHFLGRPALAMTADDGLFPISPDTWLTADEPTPLSGVATGHLLRSGTLWDAMRGFHGVFLRYVGIEAEAWSSAAHTRLQRRVTRDGDAMHSAYADLASVLDPSARAAQSPTGMGGHGATDPLFVACQWVATHHGITLRPAIGGTAMSDEHRLRRICDASRVRYRRVLLRDDWWQRDNGALLAYLDPPTRDDPASEDARPAEDDVDEDAAPRRPVALLPKAPGRYELIDPEHGTRQPVDAALAEGLNSEAVMLYPPLPEHPVGLRDLIRAAFRGSGRDIGTIAFMGLGGGLLAALIPIITGHLFGRVIPTADRSQVMQMMFMLVAAAVGAGAFQITRSIAVLRMTGRFDGSLQAAVWDRLLSLPVGFFRAFTVGDLSSRAMGIDNIRDLLLGHVTTSFLGLVFSVFSFALLFYYSVPLALAATALVVSLVLVTTTLAYVQLHHQRELLRIQGRIASLVFGLIRGLPKLRTSGAESRAFARWADRFGEQRRRTFRTQRVANLQASINAVYGVVAALTLFGMMGWALEEGVPVSRFLAFSAAFGQVQGAALTVASLVSGLLAIVPIYERLSPILKATPEVDESKIEAGDLSGEIELSHVFFRYRDDGPLILGDVSIHARPGELVALVGPSGSGKSTTLRLLLGFEKPEAGSIYYDGQDLAALDLQSVRRQVGVVLQNSRPMSGNILSNIVGATSLGPDDAWRAARMAGLEDDIKDMPMGMHTVISDGAGTFSGGQIQRLMIARAIVAQPRVIFFDEATSALDNRTQEIVSRSLESLKATRIVVAHRLSTIRNADRIYVLQAGRIVEVGDYDELVAEGGLFAELAARQTA